MKKIISILCVIMLLFSLVGCGEVKQEIGKSKKFSEEEIKNAIDCTKTYFNENFDDCKLQKIWYDEEESNRDIEGYLTHGLGLDNGSTAENTITMLTNFHVSESHTASFQPGDDYVKFMVTLIRDSKTSEWKVVECGYP